MSNKGAITDNDVQLAKDICDKLRGLCTMSDNQAINNLTNRLNLLFFDKKKAKWDFF